MKSDAQVLLVGRDEMLLQTRKLILGSYFQVEVAGRVSHAAQLMAERSFGLIVLCSSLSDHECERVAELARAQKARPKILTLSTTGRQSCGRGADDEVAEEIGPLALARKAATMLGLEMKANGRGLSDAPQPETEKLQIH
jgi:DNA-binding response OmpR family regulator